VHILSIAKLLEHVKWRHWEVLQAGIFWAIWDMSLSSVYVIQHFKEAFHLEAHSLFPWARLFL
jgi:hypothetical protein